MKKLFVELRKKNIKPNFSVLDKINGSKISLAATVQYLDYLEIVKDYLEKKGKTVLIKQGPFHEGQVIGCNPMAFDINADVLVLLADGKFHAINNAIKLDREIVVFNLRSLEKLEKKDIEKIKKRILAKKSKFLFSERIGLFVSTKFGQHLKEYLTIKKRIESKGKKVFIFESDNLDVAELENFPDIQIWINTACFGIGLDDSRVINFQDILEFI